MSSPFAVGGAHLTARDTDVETPSVSASALPSLPVLIPGGVQPQPPKLWGKTGAVGLSVGTDEGKAVGKALGALVAFGVGATVGDGDGDLEGDGEGAEEGAAVGVGVNGAAVGGGVPLVGDGVTKRM